jgi:hypothetical protein
VLMASISSRALLESPPGAGAFIVTVAMGFSPLRTGRLRPFAEGIVAQTGVCKGVRTAPDEACPTEKA